MQKRIESTQLVNTKDFSEKELNIFSDKLYEITQHIFGGGNKEEFEEMISKCTSKESKFLIYKNKEGKWVGYFGLHRFSKTIDGKNVTVFRSQAGLLPEYRRKNASMSFAVKEVLKYKFKNWSDDIYCFVAIINPSMYHITCKYTSDIFPCPSKEVPEHIKHIVDQCSIHFDFPQKDGDSFWARTVGWFPIHTEEETTFWKNSNDINIRFYQDLNPDFLKGKGLLTLVPLDTKNLLLATLKFFWYSLKKRFR